MQKAKVIDYIVCWLSNYCKDANMKGFVIGVSGGIDSAVTSTLCAKAIKNVIALNLPIYQASEQTSLAEQHIGWLKQNYEHVQAMTVDLTSSLQALEKTFPSDIQDDLTMANTRSRLRMVTLYAIASHYRMLVVGTGNKVEDFGVGFYTKYGDGGVDISPMADLMKSEVYALGRELGIMAAILEAAPTDGLWLDRRTDESQIGATYAELEWAMQYDSSPRDERQLNPRQKDVLRIYRRFHNANKHKMIPIPVCKIPAAMR
ncbi:MAG: NAD(+) synthase [Desulfobacterales bacterium]|jgi:NAD+ synthase